MSEKTQELILELLEAGNAERSSRKKESEVNYFDRQVAENFPQHVSSHNQGEQGDGGKDRSQLNSVVVGRLKATGRGLCRLSARRIRKRCRR